MKFKPAKNKNCKLILWNIKNLYKLVIEVSVHPLQRVVGFQRATPFGRPPQRAKFLFREALRKGGSPAREGFPCADKHKFPFEVILERN